MSETTEDCPKTAMDLILEEQDRCNQLCKNYLQNAVAEFRGSVDKAKLQMRELWNKRAPAGKGKKSKSKKKRVVKVERLRHPHYFEVKRPHGSKIEEPVH